MKFISYRQNGTDKIGILKDEYIVSFDSLGLEFADMSEFIAHSKSVDFTKFDPNDRNLRLEDVAKRAPIITPRQDIICLGINYMDHARESYKFKGLEFDGKREFPVYFSKRVNEAVGDEGEIASHFDITQKLDYEVELALIIGKDAKNIKAKDAREYIFGYTILNDFSARDLQNRHKQFYFGKSLDEFCAMGPVIVSSDEIDSANLGIRCFVNGELRQSSNTSCLIFDEGYVLEELSRGFTLKAGSIISMGTPGGVGAGFEPPKFLKKGDKVVCEIDGIGRLTNYIV